MRILRKLFATSLVMTLAVAVAGCIIEKKPETDTSGTAPKIEIDRGTPPKADVNGPQEGAFERLGARMDKGAEKLDKELEKGAEKLGHAMEKAGQELQEKSEEAQRRRQAEEAAKNAGIDTPAPTP